MENKILTFIVTQEHDNINAKVFLKSYCGLSSRMLSRLKRESMGITRNGSLLKTIDTLYKGDIIKLYMPADKSEIVPIKGDINILYEDEYIIAVDKPCNMPVHPTKVHQLDTLANLIAYYSTEKGEHFTFRAINRIDKDTSGIVVIAKDRYCASKLFKTLHKTYIAVCEGEIYNNGTIDKPIKVLKGHTIQRTVSPDGARAVTHYKVLKVCNNHTLLEIKLETGRTHQIRCHFSSINCPLAGDDMYGGSLVYIKRQALHCSAVSFIHPVTNKITQIHSEIPADFFKILKENE